MLTLFKPYGTIKLETELYGDMVNVVGVTEPEGPAREAEIREKIRNCDILQADVFIDVDKKLIDDAENLKAVLCTSIGVDYVDIPAMTERGILVANDPNFCVEAVAEFAVGLMFSIARQIPKAVNGVAANNWGIRRETGGSELFGKTLGLIGFGRIGREVARMGRGLGMNVIVYNRSRLKSEVAAELGIKQVTIDEVYENADFISVHVPLVPETRGLIDKKAFEKMKDGVYLINTARGGIIAEGDLLAAIESGKVAGVALDVLGEEPAGADHPLLGMIDRNVIITPHTAWYSYDAETKADNNLGEQIKAVCEGKLPPHLLNKEALSNPKAAEWFNV